VLTILSLVVLAGGAGLLVVWSVSDGTGPVRRPDLRSLRIGRRRDTSPRGAPHAERAPARDGRGRQPVPPALLAEPPLATAVPAVPAGVEVVDAPVPGPAAVTTGGGPARRRHRGDVPAAFTAVEGTYRDVAVTPLWRRGVSLLLLLGVLAGTGVAVAAVAGATLGIAAELVDGAIG